jgi:general stress protein CsbA
METTRRAGRIIGVLIVIQMVGGGIVNFTLEAPLFGAPGFLVNAAAHSQQLGLAVLFGLVTEALWVGIAITAFPIFGRRTQTMALWFIALAVVILAVAVVENAAVMSMVSLSEAYTKASAAEREQIQIFKIVVASARNWAHYIARIFDGGAIFVFYVVLYRFALVPRALASFGLIAVTLMVTAVAMPLFGHDVVFPMLAPLGLSQLILAIWLITKGFRGQPSPGVHPSDF